MRGPVIAVAAVFGLLIGAGCGGDDASDESSAEKLRVVASFYPIEEAARQVGGELVSVTNLTPAGSEAHSVELTTGSAAAVEDADVILYLGSGFQPAVEDAAESVGSEVARVDLLEEFDLRTVDDAVPGVAGEVEGEVLEGRRDPHVWVDPANFATMVEGVRDALVEADPDNASSYEDNAAAYLEQVHALDADFQDSLSSCATKVLVTSHAAFGYLAARYGLVQAPIAGISPEEEPDPQSLAATAAFAEENGVRTVFFESLVPEDLALTVADEIGATTDALDPVEGIPQEALDEGASYVTIQEDNLRRLVEGLGCTGL